MTRTAFAITIPLLLAAIFAVLGGYLIGMSFQGEGCRFARVGADMWSAASEILTAQAVFGGLFALLIAALVNVLTLRFRHLGTASSLPRWLGLSAGIAFVAATIMFVINQGFCVRSGALALAATGFGALAALALVTAVVAALAGFMQGLSAGPANPPD
jgi:hypothetical protein